MRSIRSVLAALIVAAGLVGCGETVKSYNGLCPQQGCATVSGLVERCGGPPGTKCSAVAVKSVALLDSRGHLSTAQTGESGRKIDRFDLVAQVPGEFTLEATVGSQRITRRVRMRYGHHVRANLVLQIY